MFRRSLALCALLFVTDAGALHAEGAGTPIGRTEWTNPDVSGRPPGTRSRSLSPRIRIMEREAVNTSARGAADFFFVNQSRLLVGPTCRVVLDSRFYDPELDTEVKEFSLDTLLRCITKAENILADAPKDQIIVDTPRGRIVIAGAVATIALAEDDLANGLPKRGTDENVEGESRNRDLKRRTHRISAPLQVTVSALRPGGFVSLTGPDGRKGNSGVIRRPGFVLWVDPFGEVGGPERETPEKSAQLITPLINTVSANARPSTPVPGSSLSSGDFVLADPGTVRPVNWGDAKALQPMENCRSNGCEGLYLTE